MKHNTQFIQDFMDYYDYPQEAKELFTQVLERLDSNKSFGRKFDRLYDKFEYHQARLDGKIFAPLFALSKLMGVSSYTLDFVFLLSLTKELHDQYLLLGIDEKLFWDTMADLRYKLMECIECKKIPGTFVAGWFDGFFRLDRICYGRFQFEVCTYDHDEKFVMSSGYVVNPGDIYINFHIPSSGVPLTDEVRFNSYKEAYSRVKHLFPDGKVLFGCGSWLLYPRHKEFLPESMNILKFMDDFEIVSSGERDDFGDAWRVYGADAELPLEKRPTDTKLKKAYSDWLLAGNKSGSAFGLFLFDGEKIVR